MAKPIKLTTELIRKMMEEFGESLSKMNVADGKISFTRSLAYSEKDVGGVTILFEPVAYAKMLSLLYSFSGEVAWHGTVERKEDTLFVIKDILVYPQEVTGSTVNTDQEAYQQWLMEIDDEVFNTMHMQGHSHVDFSTTPSGTDLQHQESILEQLSDEDYYIFMIFNKKLEYTIKVYDLKSNTLYEGKDISIGINCEGGDLEEFIKEAKDVVVKKTYAAGAVPSYNTYQGLQSYPAGITPGTHTLAGGKKGKKGGNQKKGAAGREPIPLPTRYPGYYGGVTPGDDIDYDEEVFGSRYHYGKEF